VSLSFFVLKFEQLGRQQGGRVSTDSASIAFVLAIYDRREILSVLRSRCCRIFRCRAVRAILPPYFLKEGVSSIPFELLSFVAQYIGSSSLSVDGDLDAGSSRNILARAVQHF
jgi:hypothetical protein